MIYHRGLSLAKNDALFLIGDLYALFWLLLIFFEIILGTVSKERTRAQAMDFLHKMNYNYTKAKFYILFPYYLTYNAYRCHDPLSITLEDMEKKIKDHLEGLKNTKEKDMEKWIDTL